MPGDYPGHRQNLKIVQDEEGIIYVANGEGILEFDGVSWRLISLPDRNVIRVVEVDEHNIKWVGGYQELGYLVADSLGYLGYQSLKDKIPVSYQLDDTIWEIFITPEGVLFNGATAIYVWRNEEFHVVKTPGNLTKGFQVGEELFFISFDRDSFEGGLYQWTQESFQFIPEGEILREMRAQVALPYKKQILFGTIYGGLFLFDGKSVSKFSNEIDTYLIQNQILDGLRLSDSIYAFSTLLGGVVLMDIDGKKIREITKEDGIPMNQVIDIALDDHKGIWLIHSIGISRVESSSLYTLFDERSNLEGRVNQVIRHQGKLYAATLNGMFMLEYKPERNLPQFSRIEEPNDGAGANAMISWEEQLIFDRGDGISQFSNGRVTRLFNGGANALHLAKKDSSCLFIGTPIGVSKIYSNSGRWKFEGRIDTITTGDVLSILEIEEGRLWLGTRSGEVIQVIFPESFYAKGMRGLDSLRIFRFNSQHGLPNRWTKLFSMDGELLALTSLDNTFSVYKFDSKEHNFYEEPQLGKKFGIDSLYLYPLSQQEEGNHILLASRPSNGRSYLYSVSKDKGTDDYNVRRIYDERFEDFSDGKAFWDENDILWLGGEKLIRYDLNAPPPPKTRFNTYVREVTIGQDSTIFGGVETSSKMPSIPYEGNDLRFSYAAPSFADPSANRYQSQLVGFDKGWSPWTEETDRDYTNIPEGDYQFRVRARNVYGTLSEIGTYDLTILPPWYRAPWAYLLYALLFGLLFYGILQWRSHKLKKDKRRLESIIAANVAEIKDQAERLQELDKAKSRFFANISHEFRTPLTLILGPLERMAKDRDREDIGEITIMSRNAKRVKHLIDQLLDLSRLESKNLQLKVGKGDVIGFLRPLFSQFQSHAKDGDIRYDVLFDPDSHVGYFDPDKLEKMIYNLLANAFKFTPGGGDIRVEVTVSGESLTVMIKDTGIGIASKELPYVFDRFHRADEAEQSHREGTGIGLALTKELVQLHHGKILVESTLGEGSAFTLLLPLSKAAYREDEIGPEVTPSPEIRPETEIPPERTFHDGQETVERPLLLLVEDNRDMREYVTKTLQKDFEVLQAVDGEDGIAKALKHVPDVIISDLMMPKKDGIELCAFLKADERTDHIPIVLLTAKASMDSRLEGLGTGADDYLTKPFETEELLIRAQNLYKQRKMLREKYSSIMVLKPQDIDITSKDEAFLKKTMEIVERHIDDSSFSVDDFLLEIGMSRTHLHRKMTALTGHSTTEFVRIQRLRRAADLLEEDGVSVSEVCYMVGFSSFSYFIKSFKRQYGINPSEYAQQKRGE